MVDLNSVYFALKVKMGFVFQQVKKGSLSSIQQVLVNSLSAGDYISSLIFENRKITFGTLSLVILICTKNWKMKVYWRTLLKDAEGITNIFSMLTALLF